MRRFARISIWDHLKNSFEHRVYEPIRDRSLSYVTYRISIEKIIWALKG